MKKKNRESSKRSFSGPPRKLQSVLLTRETNKQTKKKKKHPHKVEKG